MAKDTTKSMKPAMTDEFDIANFLPEGVSLEDFAEVGGLVPILAADFMYANKIKALVELVGWHEMPPRLAIDPAKRKAGVKEAWFTIYACAKAPVKAKSGEEIVTVEPGGFVRIPATGNLLNNEELRIACLHPTLCFLALISVKGQRDLGDGRNAMWDYEVKISPKGYTKREVSLKYALSEGPARATRGLLASSSEEPGDVRDVNGKPAGSLVGASA